MNSMAPIVRILLRYVVGGGVAGSMAFGDRLAAAPDIIHVATLGLGLVVGGATEVWYYFAKRDGGTT